MLRSFSALLISIIVMASAPVMASHPATSTPPSASAMNKLWQVAVLGDSDSQSYQMRLGSAASPPGGPFSPLTLQWTEVLDRLAGDSLNLGVWGLRGSHHVVARLRTWLGMPARTPQKEDFEFNFAFAGAGCDDLTQGVAAQLPLLLEVMDRHPGEWKKGVVVIRAGVVDFGYKDSMDALAMDPRAHTVISKMNNCVHRMQEVVHRVHATHDQVKFVIVGIFDNRHWPPYLPLWHSAVEGHNIEAGLDYFDTALRTWTESDARLAFFDERQLFSMHFGGRDADGNLAYKAWSPAPTIHVQVSQGDKPDNFVVGNGHSGLAYNILWAQHLIEVINQHFAAGVKPITQTAAVDLITQAMAQQAVKH